MIIGLTGSLGTGKTTVARMFRRLGAYVIDADRLVHKILSKGIRRKLAGFVFEDKKALLKLCSIIHPIVKKEIGLIVKRNKSRRIIIIDAPLLIESGLHRKCGIIIVVKARLRTQIERATKHLSITKGEALKRIGFQMPLREKISLADFIINNEGSIVITEKQVKQIFRQIVGAKTQKRRKNAKTAQRRRTRIATPACR